MIYGIVASSSALSAGAFTRFSTTSTGSNQLEIYATGTSTVDWGDGVIDVFSEQITHTYSVGSYVGKVVVHSPDFSYLSVAGSALVSIQDIQYGLYRLSFKGAFSGVNSPNLISVPNQIPNSLVNLSFLFSEATSFNSDISAWDTSNIDSFNGMFDYATSFNSNISGWNTSNVGVNGMSNMFYAATSFNQDLSGWCVSNIPAEPFSFYGNATAWVLPKPVWGTCPG